MANVHDVTAYIFELHGPMTTMKLQKLLYYAQAWSLVWDEEPLFPERIQAWVNGPVVPAVYEFHRGQFKVHSWSRGNPDNLTPDERETVEAVLDYYGPMTAQQLAWLTHQEDPWNEARGGLGPSERGAREITKASMYQFYEGLAAGGGT